MPPYQYPIEGDHSLVHPTFCRLAESMARKQVNKERCLCREGLKTKIAVYRIKNYTIV